MAAVLATKRSDCHFHLINGSPTTGLRRFGHFRFTVGTRSNVRIHKSLHPSCSPLVASASQQIECASIHFAAQIQRQPCCSNSSVHGFSHCLPGVPHVLRLRSKIEHRPQPSRYNFCQPSRGGSRKTVRRQRNPSNPRARWNSVGPSLIVRAATTAAWSQRHRRRSFIS